MHHRRVTALPTARPRLRIFALLGGLQVYGFLGVFLAPVALAVLLSFLDIYRERYVGAEPSEPG